MHSREKLSRTVTLIICLLFLQSLMSQNRADNWILWHSRLHFQNNTVEVLHSIPSHFDTGTGVINDKEGNLLMFTDGRTVFNKDKVIMVGGSNIFDYEYPMSQSLIVPLPGSDSLYYLFFVDGSAPVGENHTGLYYAIVDISLYNGKGAVIYVSGKLLDNVTSRLTAVFHQNYNDVWIITQKKAVNQFYAYLITENGIPDSPVISVGGEAFPNNYSGQLKVAPDGTKIVNSYDAWSSGIPGQGFDIFKFDAQTGELTNPLIFKVPMRACQSAEFSSDASKLYIFQNGSTGESTLFQYDVSEYGYDEINSSRVSLLQPMFNGFFEMQLAPDGKIYIGKNGDYLGLIEYPNQSGLSCEVVELGLYLDGLSSGLKMPNFNQSYFYKTDFQVHSFCLGDTTSFGITNMFRLDSVKWDFGDNQYSTQTNPTHIYEEAGQYTVSLIGHYPEKTDTIRKTIEIHSLPVVDLGNDTTVCQGYVLDLSGYPYSFLWSDGTTLPYLIPATSGTYGVRTTDENTCMFYDVINLIVKPTPYFSLGNDTTICENSDFYLRPHPAYENSDYLWNDNSSDTVLHVGIQGLYSLEITNSEACSFFDNVYIEMYESPDVDLGNDTVLSHNSSTPFLLDAGYFGWGTTYLWENNSSSQYRYIYPQLLDVGMHQFHVKVTTSPDECVATDTINIKITGPSSIDENKINIRVYPNPCSKYFVVINNGNTNKNMKLFNSLGQLVLSDEVQKGRQIIEISNLRRDVYTAAFYENEAIVLRLKIIVE